MVGGPGDVIVATIPRRCGAAWCQPCASARELAATASLSPRERLRLELTHRYGDMARNLDEALAERNGEKAVRLYWDLVDQAYGKLVQSLEAKAGPIKDIESRSTEELEPRLAGLAVLSRS